jgi:hypothetical protein
MKKILVLALALFVASCASCDKADEDYTPFPGAKNSKEQPKA